MIEDFTLRARVSGFLNLQSSICNLQDRFLQSSS